MVFPMHMIWIRMLMVYWMFVKRASLMQIVMASQTEHWVLMDGAMRLMQ